MTAEKVCERGRWTSGYGVGLITQILLFPSLPYSSPFASFQPGSQYHVFIFVGQATDELLNEKMYFVQMKHSSARIL